MALGIPAGFVQLSPIDYATAGVDVALPFLVLAAMPVLVLATVHRTVEVKTLMACLAVIGVLWAGALHGASTGREYAQHFAANFAGQPEVMLLTRARLQIVGPGVTVEELPYGDSADYRYCCRGLRYLMENNRYIIYVPVGWSPGVDPLFHIPTKTNMRVDTKPGNDARPGAKCSDR